MQAGAQFNAAVCQLGHAAASRRNRGGGAALRSLETVNGRGQFAEGGKNFLLGLGTVHDRRSGSSCWPSFSA